MSTVLLVDFLIIIVSIVFTVLLVLQARKLWRIRFSLEKSLLDLKRLNQSINNIFRNTTKGGYDDGFSHRVQKKVCESCKNRLTYIDYISDTSLFFYTCKLTNEKINLDQTCKNYQKDFHYLNR